MKNHRWVKFILGGAGMILLFGCTTAPFGKVKLASLTQQKSADIIQNYSRQLPHRFTAAAGIVFDWHYRKLSTLCVTRVDCSPCRISVVGMNLLGVKIFSATGGPRQAKMLFCALKKQIKKPDAFATAMVKDIAHIYCHKLDNYRISKRNKKELQIDVDGADSVVTTYLFTGRSPRLIKKSATLHGKQLWQVEYFNYRRYGTTLLPDKIVYDNWQNAYRLVIRVKNITAID